MRRLLQLGMALTLGAASLHGAEMANLRNGFSIRHERHELIGDNTRLYMGADDSSGYMDVPTAEVANFEPAPALPPTVSRPVRRDPVDIDAIIREVSRRSQVDADFIASVVRAESGNNPAAVSRKGAVGLMQLMPGTADQLGVKDSFDPAANVDGGVRYLLDLLTRYNYDVAKALAAYNAGPQRVMQYHGVPPYRETRAYVARIINDYNRKKRAEMKKAQMAKASTPSAGAAQ